jgi:hypothetical protein
MSHSQPVNRTAGLPGHPTHFAPKPVHDSTSAPLVPEPTTFTVERGPNAATGASWAIASFGKKTAHAVEDSAAVSEADILCADCGEPMFTTSTGVTHHTDADGGVDHDADAAHVAYSDDDEFVGDCSVNGHRFTEDEKTDEVLCAWCGEGMLFDSELPAGEGPRVTASVQLQVNVSADGDYRAFGKPIEFDVTDIVAGMSAAELSDFEDDDYQADALFHAAVDRGLINAWPDQPFSVTALDSINEYVAAVALVAAVTEPDVEDDFDMD